MLILDTTTIKLQAVLSAPVTTTELDIAVGYGDQTASAYTKGRHLARTTGTTAVDIMLAPAAATMRNGEFISTRNRDTVAASVTFQINDNGTIYELWKVTLASGETFGFTHSAGPYCNDVNGNRKGGAVQDLSGYLTIIAAAAGYQPLNSDLSAIAALATTSYGRGLLALADAAAGRTALGLGTAATSASTAFDAAGAAAAAQAASQPVDSDLTAIAALTTTTFGRALLELADAAALRTAAGLGSVDNTADANKPVSTAQAAADAQVLVDAKAYTDGAVVGLYDPRGNYDASGNVFPSSGGSGAAGAVVKGDIWRISVSGTLGTEVAGVGDEVVALVDSPGQTAANWNIYEHNLGYVPEPQQTAASQAEAEAGTGTSIRSWTPQRIWQAIAAALTLGTWITGATGKTTPVDADTFPGSDSAASGVLKKFTWANIKATLKTYFDSLTTTLTNKRITARVLSEAFSATPTINTDSYDEYHATAMSGAITSMTSNLTGTPVTGDILVCEFTDDGTARTITWGASFEASTLALPVTTVISTLLTVTLKFNAATSKWRCVGVA